MWQSLIAFAAKDYSLIFKWNTQSECKYLLMTEIYIFPHQWWQNKTQTCENFQMKVWMNIKTDWGMFWRPRIIYSFCVTEYCSQTQELKYLSIHWQVVSKRTKLWSFCNLHLISIDRDHVITKAKLINWQVIFSSMILKSTWKI